eukprot:4260601-Amphidinium_carterae.1
MEGHILPGTRLRSMRMVLDNHARSLPSSKPQATGAKDVEHRNSNLSALNRIDGIVGDGTTNSGTRLVPGCGACFINADDLEIKDTHRKYKHVPETRVQ